MTDHIKKQVQQRREMRQSQERKKRLILLVFILMLSCSALLFHKEKFSALPEILTWLQQSSPEGVIVTTATNSPRANIYDRNLRPLATTYETYAIYARPLEMEDPNEAAEQLEQHLGLGKNKLLADLKSERGFVWIIKGIDKELADTIKDSNIKGIYQVVESERFYPNGESGAHAVGFVENDQGLDGVEFQYNTLLRGDEISAAELQELQFGPTDDFATGPTHLVLHLDLMLQSKIERFLEKRARITGATSGAAVLMDADNGSILAMTSYPFFNPNRYWEFPSNSLSNNAVSQPVYPGELALIFQQAAAINQKNQAETADSTTTQPGALLVIEPRILKKRRLSTAPRVATVNAEYLSRFIEQLGFYQEYRTDIPLKDETAAAISVAMSDPTFHTSALRLLTGFTALVNSGRLVSPRLLHSAYPKEYPEPLKPSSGGLDQPAMLHPSTSSELIDFLTTKWLRVRPSSQTPMFFEAHRYVSQHRTPPETFTEIEASADSEPEPRITQTVMLGAIPAKDPRLTMVAFLTYPDSSEQAYADVIETFGNKFSILSPDMDMVRKMRFVAEHSPPVPSPDFWADSTTLLAADTGSLQQDHQNTMVADENSRKLMPDVTGKSLRAGLQTLQHFNLDIKLIGSGRIVSQQPAAGTELSSNAECILKMQQEI